VAAAAGGLIDCLVRLILLVFTNTRMAEQTAAAGLSVSSMNPAIMGEKARLEPVAEERLQYV
jgi:hypothetical protein